MSASTGQPQAAGYRSQTELTIKDQPLEAGELSRRRHVNEIGEVKDAVSYRQEETKMLVWYDLEEIKKMQYQDGQSQSNLFMRTPRSSIKD